MGDRDPAESTAARGRSKTKLGRAWLMLCAAFAIHVADEALTGFLSVYNPTVRALRQSLPWLPMPLFDFPTWLAGLILLIAVLFRLSAWVSAGSRGARVVAYVFASIMVLNALGHTAGTVFGRTVETVRFSGAMPGFYSSPVLLAAAIYVLKVLRSRPSGQRRGGRDITPLPHGTA